MGRRKQKVRWTSLEEGIFSSDNNSADTMVVISSDMMDAHGEDMDSSGEVNNASDSSSSPPNFAHSHSLGNEPNSKLCMNRYFDPPNNHSLHQGHYLHYNNAYYRGSKRRFGGAMGPVAPRFERKAAAEAGGTHHHHHHHHNNNHFYKNGHSDHNHIESSEDLPNGFTKIRSKNLDVLFRKDYYAQRAQISVNGSQSSSTAVSSEHGEDEQQADEDLHEERDCALPVVDEAASIQEGDDDIEAPKGREGSEQQRAEEEEEVDAPPSTSPPSSSCCPSSQSTCPSSSTATSSPSSSSSTSKSTISENAKPFFPSSHYVSSGASVYGGAALSNLPGGRTNLFLYSPCSNTIIPCDEIVIPNPGDGNGQLYPGPSSIYLAFPMDHSAPAAPNSTALSPAPYLPHPTPMVQYDQYGVPYASYQPTGTVPDVMPSPSSDDGSGSGGSATASLTGVSSSVPPNASAHCSSPTSYDASAESTATNSPLDLSVYSPANWVAAGSNTYYAAMAGHQQPWFGMPSAHYQPYHPQKRPFYNTSYQSYAYYSPASGHGANARPTFVHFTDQRTRMTSSAGDSLAEEEEEGSPNEPQHKKILPMSSSSSAEHSADQDRKDKVAIPGLSIDRVSSKKKRRKKKAANLEINCHLKPYMIGDSLVSTPTEEVTKKPTSSYQEELPAPKVQDQVLQQPPELSVDERKPEPEPEEGHATDEEEEEEEVKRPHEEKKEVEKKEEGPEVPVVECQDESEDSIAQPSDDLTVPEEPEQPPAPTIMNETVTIGDKEVCEDEVATAIVAVETLPKEEDEEEKTSSWSAPLSQPSSNRRKRGKRSGQNLQVRNQTKMHKSIEEVKKPVEPMKQDPQWELIPQELKESESWETPTRTRKSRKSKQLPSQHQVLNNEDEEVAAAPAKEEPQIESSSQCPEAVEDAPVVLPSLVATEQVNTEEDERTTSSSSVPQRSSSNKKQNSRKKRSSLDDGENVNGSSQKAVPRPILIMDGFLDLTSGSLHQHRPIVKRASDVISDDGRIVDQAVIISNIGYGMKDGPMTMGRFGLGKYTPPDRSNEILSSILAKSPLQPAPEEKNVVDATVQPSDQKTEDNGLPYSVTTDGPLNHDQKAANELDLD